MWKKGKSIEGENNNKGVGTEQRRRRISFALVPLKAEMKQY